MDQQSFNNIWKKILGEIETEISRANFLTLFKNTSLISIDNNVATIATPSNMIIDLLKKKFYPVIKTALDKHVGREVNIVFIPRGIVSSLDKEGPLFEIAKDGNVRDIAERPLSRVRADFTFENLAVSASNQLAFVSAQTVAKNIGKSYNPLFIYGPVGVGKTHLMQAIANDVYKKDPSKKVIYTTSEEFTNEVVDAIRTNDTAKMKRRFRTIDLLIIDDVQFVAGKDRVQEELFHTFNILIDNSSQVVLSSDRPPHEIKKLERRLSSRFSSGLTVDIESPDFELRTAIILIKAKRRGIEFSIECAKLIAEKSQDTRALEGLLLRVVTESVAKNKELTLDFVSAILGNQKGEAQSKPYPDELVNIVCKFYNLKPTQIKGPKRDALLVRARHVAMYLLKKELDLTLVEIGNLLGGRDHTTVMHGVEKLESSVEKRNGVSQDIVGISKLISEQNRDFYMK